MIADTGVEVRMSADVLARSSREFVCRVSLGVALTVGDETGTGERIVVARVVVDRHKPVVKPCCVRILAGFVVVPCQNVAVNQHTMLPFAGGTW